ncbi:HAD family hydrolase [Agromyces sp. NPDC058104]|uniref:HAD family hydrolase n=1 Tax=Agromyces sp. NPDC058104 TaxID=3346342 RepID=UPI0036D84A25
MAGNHAGRVVAYFDVDHTLTRIGSLESFIHFYAGTASGAVVSSRVDALLSLAAHSTDLDEIHQAFANAFRGESWSNLREAGVAWHTSVASSLYQENVVNALQSHLDGNDEIVFVSGSWAPCLEPIARELGVGTVLQSVPQLEQDGDTLSGAFEVMMLGPRKASAVRAHAEQTRTDLGAAYAYADHRSDEPLLRIVGNPIVVGNDPHLVRIAAANSWRLFPGTA